MIVVKVNIQILLEALHARFVIQGIIPIQQNLLYVRPAQLDNSLTYQVAISAIYVIKVNFQI